ncbi:MAG: hypothetical protein F9K40_14765 [Kofleriaceae bacterium]|nr:MAG: hypothetical protein F9K40_14765 [Kofleriaceae bacterium]MBZ0231683.1 hypothetical protein [Kofleriaceae bacterium]
MATPEQVRAFLDRPWVRLRREKDRTIAARVAREGAESGLRMATQLRLHVEALGLALTDADRRADLEAAVRLRRLLDRAGRRQRRAR